MKVSVAYIILLITCFIGLVLIPYSIKMELSSCSVQRTTNRSNKTDSTERVDTFYNMNGDMITITKKVKTSK